MKNKNMLIIFCYQNIYIATKLIHNEYLHRIKE
jgi:hypothetical protein